MVKLSQFILCLKQDDLAPPSLFLIGRSSQTEGFREYIIFYPHP